MKARRITPTDSAVWPDRPSVRPLNGEAAVLYAHRIEPDLISWEAERLARAEDNRQSRVRQQLARAQTMRKTADEAHELD